MKHSQKTFKNPRATHDFKSRSCSIASVGSYLPKRVLTNGELWEQNPSFAPIGLNSGYRMLSGNNGLPGSFLSVAAEAGTTTGNAFAIASNNTIWDLNNNTQLSTTLLAAQISAAQTAAGTDLLFATLTDGELWEYQAGPGASPAGFSQLLTGDVSGTSAP